MTTTTHRTLAVLLVLIAAGCGGETRSALCGAGTVEQDGLCLRIDGGTMCGAGTAQIGGQCVALDAGAGDVCGPGTVLDGNQCVAVDAGVLVCGPGTVLQGSACVAVDGGTTTCGPGTTLVGGQCVADDAGTGIVCAPGTVLDGGVCIAIPGITCGPGETQTDGGTCVPAGTECPAACNAPHIVPDLGCLPCPCFTPYYDATCSSQANSIAISAIDYGSLGPGGADYYSFLLPSSAGYGFVTVDELGSTGSFDVYVRQSYLPFALPFAQDGGGQITTGGPGMPDYAYSDTASAAHHLVLVPPPTPPTDYYYVLIRRNGTSLAASLDYKFTVIPY